MALFRKSKYTFVKLAKKKDIPHGLWTKCPDCGELIYNKALKENLKVCQKCNYHFTLSAQERITLLLDRGSFCEIESSYGHDAFLLEVDEQTHLIKHFLNREYKKNGSKK